MALQAVPPSPDPLSNHPAARLFLQTWDFIFKADLIFKAYPRVTSLETVDNTLDNKSNDYTHGEIPIIRSDGGTFAPRRSIRRFRLLAEYVA